MTACRLLMFSPVNSIFWPVWRRDAGHEEGLMRTNWRTHQAKDLATPQKKVQGVRKPQLKSGQTMKLATLSNKTLPRFATSTGRDKCLNLFQVPLRSGWIWNVWSKGRKGEKKNGAKRFCGHKGLQDMVNHQMLLWHDNGLHQSHLSEQLMTLAIKSDGPKPTKMRLPNTPNQLGPTWRQRQQNGFQDCPNIGRSQWPNCVDMHVFRSMFPYAESEAGKCPIVSLFTGRSEVYAILAAVAAYKRLTIYRDCEAAM